jgi:cytochrome P450
MSTRKFEIDLAAAGTLGDRFIAQLDALRESEPVHWSAASKCWLVTRHADVDLALQGRLPLSTKRLVSIGLGAIPEQDRPRLFPTMMRYMPHFIIDLDPPDHTRLRRLLLKAFSKKVVDGVRPFVQQRINVLLDGLAQVGEVEFNEAVARQLPGSVILHLLGLPQEHLVRLRRWANALQQGIGVPFASVDALREADAAMAEMNEILLPELAYRRANPRNDLLTALVQASEDGETLTEDEMLGSLHLLIVAGHDTTSNTLAMGTALLARRPHAWAYLYEHPEHGLKWSLELMRQIAMSAAQPRIASADFEWHGRQIKLGDVVFLMLASANRDPRVFTDPDVFQPLRDNDRSMVFAPGLHHCIGHLLAKMQVTEFFCALVQRFSGAQLLDEQLHFMPQIAFRGLFDLRLRAIPRVKNEQSIRSSV